MAKKYPDAYILGVDLVPMQPRNRPMNCDFQSPRDYEGPWLLGEDSWDLIRLQMGCGSVSNWPNLYRRIIAHLRPGTGYFEQVEIDFKPHVEPELAPDQALSQWYQHLKDATDMARKPIAFNRNIPHMLKEAGFVDIDQQLIGLPLNEWCGDQHEREVGKWYNLAFSESTSTLLQAPLTRISNWQLDQIHALAAAATSQAYNKNIKAYNLLHIITARRPSQVSCSIHFPPCLWMLRTNTYCGLCSSKAGR